MKTKFKLLLLLFSFPLLMQAQDCDSQSFGGCNQVLDLSPEMFSYSGGSEDPLGPSGVGNLADEQLEMSSFINGGNNTLGGATKVWDDFNYTGILDLGTAMDLYTIYLAIAPGTNPAGGIRITPGRIGSPGYDANDYLVETYFPSSECTRGYELIVTSPPFNPIANLSVRYLTIERLGGLEGVTEMLICGEESPIMISGNASTECGKVIPEATVQLIEILNGMVVHDELQTTDMEGNYKFSNLNEGSDYFIQIIKEDQITCGLDVYDRIAIQNHISQGPFLNTPYQLLAADVNNDDVIDQLDYDYLSAMFVNDGNTNFPVDWKFVRSNYVFPNPANPFGIDLLESEYFESIATSQVQDFIGIKIGDAACSYSYDCVEEGISLTGCTATHCGEAVPGAEVELVEVFNDGNISTVLVDYAITNASGCYEFFRRTPNSDYIVTIAKGDQIDCGIDEMDFRALQEHILFISSLTGPYELLAADVDVDGDINAYDLVLMTWAMIGQYGNFIDNGGIPWTFIRRGHVFSNPSNPFVDLPLNTWTVSASGIDLSSLDFTAVKNGDINCTYDSGCTTGNPPSPGNDDGGSGGERRSDLDFDWTVLSGQMNVTAQPNPFKDVTVLNLELTEEGPVTIHVYNMLGQEIFTQKSDLGIGVHQVVLDQIADHMEGALPYLIEQNGKTISGKLLKIK